MDNAVQLAGRGGKKHLGFDAVDFLVFEPCGGLPAAGIILVAELFVEANGLKVLFLFDLGDSLVFADHLPLRVVGQANGGQPIDQ